MADPDAKEKLCVSEKRCRRQRWRVKKEDFFHQEKITQGSMEDSTYRRLGSVGVAWREVKEAGSIPGNELSTA